MRIRIVTRTWENAMELPVYVGEWNEYPDWLVEQGETLMTVSFSVMEIYEEIREW